VSFSLLLPLLLCLPCAADSVTLKTDDGWTLAADYAAGKKGKPAAVLVHGFAAGRGEYAAFAKTLNARGWTTLALDLRGHGASARPGGTFETIGEWDTASQDLLAAFKLLEKRGVREKQLVLIGASLGANLCAKVFAALPRARRLVLLSPGLDYRGLRLPRLDAARAVVAASRGDAYAWRTAAELKAMTPGLTVIEAGSGHGAQMLSDAGFLERLLKAL
jgi:alpha-beta hydrolase superfamily lysophospholipase